MAQLLVEGRLKIVKDCPNAPPPYQRWRAFALAEEAKKVARVTELDHSNSSQTRGGSCDKISRQFAVV